MNDARTHSLDQLQCYFAALPPGPIADVPSLRRLLAAAWDDLLGDDGGMEPDKLFRPLEEATWTPPVVSFVIERHGGLSQGGTRAERQHWHVDVEKGIATLAKIGWRQDRPQRERYPVKATAAEVVEAVRKGQKDDRLRWDGPDKLKLVTTKLFPEGSGYRRTVEGQRKAFRSYVAAALTAEGWKQLGNDLFERTRSRRDRS